MSSCANASRRFCTNAWRMASLMVLLDPRLVWTRHGELPLEEVGDQHGRFPDRPAPRAIAMKRPQIVLAHQPRDTMLAASLSCLTQVQEHARGAVDALTRDERRTDQAEQPRVLLGPIGDRLVEPCVVASGGHSEHATHRLHAELVPMGLDERVRRADSPGTQSSGHQHRPLRLRGC